MKWRLVIDNAIYKNYDASEPRTGTKPLGKMRIKLKNTALTCDHFQILNKAAAAVVSGMLENVGIVTNDDYYHVVDKCKIRRDKS